MRDEKQALKDFRDLIARCVSDQNKRREYLHELDAISPPPLRGILSAMHSDGIEINGEDRELVHEAFFYYG